MDEPYFAFCGDLLLTGTYSVLYSNGTRRLCYVFLYRIMNRGLHENERCKMANSCKDGTLKNYSRSKVEEIQIPILYSNLLSKHADIPYDGERLFDYSLGTRTGIRDADHNTCNV